MRARTRRLAGLLAMTSLVVIAVIGTAMPVRAAVGVNLDQWASLETAWQNGNLNGNNARYPEGGIVPFRLAIEGLRSGSHEVHINYDFTAGGHKAYDFLATWNAWSKPGICSAGGGGVSSMCPSLPGSSSYPFPTDPFTADGLSVTTAEIYSGVSRRLTIWGGTITSISKAVHSGPVSGNSSADLLVRFRSTGSAVLLAWGGHLAQSAFWNRAAGGERDGAGEVSGAPWHMRTLQLDAAGNKNQDRSIQPSAIVGELPPFALAPPTPAPRPTAPPAAPVPPGTSPPNPGTTARPGAPQGPGAVPTPPATSTVATGARDGASGAASIAAVLALVAGSTAAIAGRRRSRPR